jgi:hypothetical protein
MVADRQGKTDGCGLKREEIHSPNPYPFTSCLPYVTESVKNAKEIVWRETAHSANKYSHHTFMVRIKNSYSKMAQSKIIEGISLSLSLHL